MDNASIEEENRFLHRRGYWWQYGVAAIILFLGLGLSLIVYVLLDKQEQNYVIRDFERASHDRSTSVEKTVDLDILTLQSVQAFYDGSQDVDRNEFNIFTEPFLSDHPSIHAIIWAPRVLDSERGNFEKEVAQSEGIKNFEIREIDPEREWHRASVRKEYFPFLFMKTLYSDTALLGQDLAAIEECQQAMQKACDTDNYQLTGKMSPVFQSECVDAWAFFPVYNKDFPQNTVEERRLALKGYIVGIVSPKWIVKEGISDLLPIGIDIELFDTTVPGQPQLFYSVSTRARQKKTELGDPVLKRSGLCDVHRIEIDGRQWSVVCSATRFFVASRATWYPEISAIGIFLISIVLGIFLVVITYRNVQEAKLANQLQDTHQQLKREVKGREYAEAVLTTSEIRYQTLFEASADAILLLTPKGTIVDANRAAVQYFRLKHKGELISGNPADVSPEDQFDGICSREKAQAMLDTAMEKGFHSFEWLHHRVDGSEFLGLVTLTKMEMDGKTMVLATLRDIDEQRRAEKALEASERRFRLFARDVEDVLWTMDLKGRFTYFSPSVERMLGFQWEEGMEVTLADIMTPESQAVSQEALQDLMKQIAANKPFESRKIELEAIRVDGSKLWIEIAVSAMCDEKGEVVGALGVTRDIDERKRMEDELRQAKDAAEAATRSKSQFLATISHEIRVPMTSILGYADLLLDPTVNASTRNNYAATIRRSGEHLLALINDILDISKIEAGRMGLEIAPCKIVSLLADVASVMRPRAEMNAISFTVEYQETIPETISTDGSRLRQIILNLVGNAVKFTEKGGVRIVVSFIDKGKVFDDQAAVQFQVIDTGIGIHEEVLNRLFQPFVQGDNKVTQRFGGTGLGLAISRHLAQMLGGDLAVESVWKEGSTFTLTVPTGDLEGVRILECPNEVVHETKERVWQKSEKNLEGIEVLLVEDGLDNQRLIQAVLIKAGATVKAVENGRMAVDEARKQTFDVILMDMNMPVMDGYEATSVLRDQGYPGPILALTANAMKEDRERCCLAGCDDYLTKPIDRALLIQAVKQYANVFRATMDRPASGAEKPSQKS